MKTLTLFALLLLSSAAFCQQDITISMLSGGIQRSFAVHLPMANPPANLPVLFCFHGTGGTSTGMAGTSGFNALADQNNFIAVYPQAVTVGADIQWNAYVDDQPGDAAVGDPNAPDDVLFTKDMINRLSTDYSIDRKRVYASGLSNGGFMCYALAMFAYKEIAAIAPVAGNLWGEDKFLQSISADPNITPIPDMHIHGTADNVVDYPDPDNTQKPYEEWPLFFAGRGCGGTTYTDVVPIMANVDKLVFCPPPVEVSLIRIKGMGHAWSDGVYPTSREIVKFFNLKQGSSGVGAQEKVEEVHLQSSVVDISLRVTLDNSSTLQIFNTLGEIIYQQKREAGQVEIPTKAFGAGIYMLRIASVSGAGNSQKIIVKH
jgi:poly(3-hydroxybutyrate) depolymerase